MSRPSRWSVVLSAAVTAALSGALLSAAPATASGQASAAPKSSHVKVCKEAGLGSASKMRLQSSKKAVGKSRGVKVTARAWVYTTSKRKEACVVTSANSPRVKKTGRTLAVEHTGGSALISDAVIRFKEGHVFNATDPFDLGDSDDLGRTASKNLAAHVVDIHDDEVMTAEDIAEFPKEMHGLKGKAYTIDATNLELKWQVTGTRTVKIKKVKKAKALKTRKANYKKIESRRKADVRKTIATWKKWAAAQPQSTVEERAWVKYYGEVVVDLKRWLAKWEAKSARSEARQKAKDAMAGKKTQTAYDIDINLALTVPQR